MQLSDVKTCTRFVSDHCDDDLKLKFNFTFLFFFACRSANVRNCLWKGASIDSKCNGSTLQSTSSFANCINVHRLC